jgi:hypothetical protein
VIQGEGGLCCFGRGGVQPLFARRGRNTTHLVHVWLGTSSPITSRPFLFHKAHYSRSAATLYIPPSAILR